MTAIYQTTFSHAFPWMKMYEFRLKFHWSLFVRVQLTIYQHWFRWWLGADQATSHYLNQWWLVYWRIYASLGLNELKVFTSIRPGAQEVLMNLFRNMCSEITLSSQWRHNEPNGVSNHQHRDCLFNRLFMRKSKKTSKLRVTGLCVRNSPVAGEFPAQRASNAENVSIWWRHHGHHYHISRGPMH